MTCFYPGSFDPMTKGHENIIARCAAIFPEVVVGVLYNPEKQGTFPVEKRVEMLRRVCARWENVRVISHDGLLVDYIRREDIRIVARGVRTVADLENETAQALINRQMYPEMETIFLPAEPELAHVSSSFVRQLASFHASLEAFVPAEILPDVRAVYL